MTEKTANEDTLVRYLLGELPESEQQQIEERFFDDDEFYRQLLEVEDELRCAYAQGTLPLTQKEQFEKRFLIFPDERKRVELAREMIAELPQISLERAWLPASPEVERKTRRRLSWPFGLISPSMRFAMAAAVIVVVAGFVWLLLETARLRNQLGELRAGRTTEEQQFEQRSAEERARVEQLGKQLEEEQARRAQLEEELARSEQVTGQTNGQSPRPAIISLLLMAGRIRGGGETKRLVLPPAVDQVRLQLELAGSEHKHYRAVIMNSEGNEVWSRAGLRARTSGARRIVTLSTPARLLAEDDYELQLTSFDGAGQSERAGSYYFTVLKK